MQLFVCWHCASVSGIGNGRHTSVVIGGFLLAVCSMMQAWIPCHVSPKELLMVPRVSVVKRVSRRLLQAHSRIEVGKALVVLMMWRVTLLQLLLWYHTCRCCRGIYQKCMMIATLGRVSRPVAVTFSSQNGIYLRQGSLWVVPAHCIQLGH